MEKTCFTKNMEKNMFYQILGLQITEKCLKSSASNAINLIQKFTN